MIKIIEKGRFEYKIRCDECKCLFSFEAEDVEWEKKYDNHGSYAADWYNVTCPYCDYPVSIAIGSYPKLIEERDKMKKINE